MSPLSVDVFDTMFRKAVFVNIDVVLVRIARLLESNKCFFAIATGKCSEKPAEQVNAQNLLK
jgi:hypothetical protein